MAEIKKINTELQPIDKLLDTSGDAGTSGQILSSTGSGTNWIANTGGGGTVTGTGADEQVTYWISNTEIDGDSGFKYNKSSGGYAAVTLSSASAPQLCFKETGSAYTESMRLLRDSDKLKFTYGDNANEEAMTIVGGTGSDLGYVGIGTVTPDAKLSVTSTSTNSEDILYLKSGIDNADEYLGIAFEVGGGGNGPHGAVRVYNGPSSSDTYMSLLTTTDGGTLTQGLTQNHLGYVGIGTTSPGEKLEVNGNIKVIESGQTPDVSVFHSDGSYAKLRGQGLFLSRSTCYVAPVADNFGSLAVGYNGARWGNVEINAATVKFENGANEFMRVTSSGDLGIGTTTPDAKLEVVGGIIAGGKTTYTISSASLTTTGTAVAGLSTGTNLQSSGFIFTCFGGDGFQRIVYSCRNESGTWNIDKDIDEGVNAFDVTYAADGSDNITFTFKSRSGTQSYAPRVTVEAIGDQIQTSYIN